MSRRAIRSRDSGGCRRTIRSIRRQPANHHIGIPVRCETARLGRLCGQRGLLGHRSPPSPRSHRRLSRTLSPLCRRTGAQRSLRTTPCSESQRTGPGRASDPAASRRRPLDREPFPVRAPRSRRRRRVPAAARNRLRGALIRSGLDDQRLERRWRFQGRDLPFDGDGPLSKFGELFLTLADRLPQ